MKQRHADVDAGIIIVNWLGGNEILGIPVAHYALVWRGALFSCNLQ